MADNSNKEREKISSNK